MLPYCFGLPMYFCFIFAVFKYISDYYLIYSLFEVFCSTRSLRIEIVVHDQVFDIFEYSVLAEYGSILQVFGFVLTARNAAQNQVFKMNCRGVTLVNNMVYFEKKKNATREKTYPVQESYPAFYALRIVVYPIETFTIRTPLLFAYLCCSTCITTQVYTRQTICKKYGPGFLHSLLTL